MKILTLFDFIKLLTLTAHVITISDCTNVCTMFNDDENHENLNICEHPDF